MSRDYKLYLDDMYVAAEKVLRYAQGFDLSAFLSDERTFDAVMRNLEVLGEAAKHVPPEVRGRYPAVAWRHIAGLRDIVAHEYFGIDEDILWDIVKNQIPALLEHLDGILEQERDEE